MRLRKEVLSEWSVSNIQYAFTRRVRKVKLPHWVNFPIFIDTSLWSPSVIRLLYRQEWWVQAKNQVLIMQDEHSSKRFPHMPDFLPTWILNHLNNWISCSMIFATLFLSPLTVQTGLLILEMQEVFSCILGLA